jgi:protoporphyrinogen oxidase
VEVAGKPDRVYCDSMISTIPITKMVPMLHPEASFDLLEKVRTLKYRAMVVMYIVVKKKQVSPYQWVYYSSDDIFFNRFSECKNLTPKLMPPDRTVLCLETTCFEGDEIWNASEETVYTECMKGLEKLGLVKESYVEAHFLVKLPYAYPIANLEYEKNYPDILSYLSRYTNLLSMGRQGSFAYLNMDQSMEEGFRAARIVLDRAKDALPGSTAPETGTNEGV